MYFYKVASFSVDIPYELHTLTQSCSKASHIVYNTDDIR